MLFIRKPDRIEIPDIHYIDERRDQRHRLLLLSDEGGIEIDLERRRWEIVKDSLSKEEALKRLCGECSFLGEAREAIEETPRWRVDFQEPLSAGLFELEEGYMLILNLSGESRVEYIDAPRLIGVSVTEEIHSLAPEEYKIVKLPELEPIEEIEAFRGEPLAFTDDEYEKIIVTDIGIRIE